MPANPEKLLISAILNEGDHVTPGANGVSADMFHAHYDEFLWIEKYIRQHRRTPSRAAFKAKFPGTRVDRTVTDVAHFCTEVKEAAAQSNLVGSIQDALEHIRNGDLQDATKLIHQASIAAEVALEGGSGNVDIIQNWEEGWEEAAARHKRVQTFGMAGIPTGLPTLDDRTGGVQQGQFWVVSARLGEGKTWMLIRMAIAACFGGFNVQYNSLEMARHEISSRVSTFSSSEHGKQVFKNMDLVQGRDFDPREYKEFLREMQTKVQGKFHVADQRRGKITTRSIEAQLERVKPDILYLDYITLMEESRGSDWRSTSNLSGDLKGLCGRYSVPIVAAAQLNRDAAARRDLPGAENLAEADAIGRDADVVITMRMMSERVIAMKLAKNRNGRGGAKLYVKFLPNTGILEEIGYQEARELIDEDKQNADDDENSVPGSLPKPRTNSGFQPVMKKDEDEEPSRKIVRRRADQDG